MYLLFMNKLLFILLFIFISNCTLNKVIKHHGVNFLDKKQKNLELNSTNKNDILKVLGPPSTKSTFDNDIWIYIERKISKSSIVKLGKKKIVVNNVLILEINNTGILVKKDFFNIKDMKKIKFSKETTEVTYSKNSFVYDFLSSMRQKMNDPLGKRKKRK
jgi:outer membrane protein assembly factor BamE (lipoprotein component of BamABCDE complex)